MSVEKGDRVSYLVGGGAWTACTGTVEAVGDTQFGITVAAVRRDTTPDVHITDMIDVAEAAPEGTTPAELTARIHAIFGAGAR